MRAGAVVTPVASEFLWRPSEHADECATHPLAVAETGRICHLFDGMRAVFEHHPRDLYTQRFDRLCGRLARLLPEGTRKLSHAQMRGCREFVDREVGTKILPCVGERCLDAIELKNPRKNRRHRIAQRRATTR